MKDSIRKDLEKLCHSILANDEDEALANQLTRVQMLYERLLVLNYLSQKEEEKAEKQTQPEPAPRAPQNAPVQEQEKQAGQQPLPKAPEARVVPSTSAAAESEPEKPAEATAPAQKAKQPDAKPEPHFRESGPEKEMAQNRQNSLNDRLARGTIEVGLNDRLAFVKHLFGGQQEDFNRVLSQLNTAGSYKEAAGFLQDLVKPEYDWSEKEEYEERLMQLIRQKFGEENN